jgi:hypothetical protein
MTDKVKQYLASIGSKGGKAGTGESKRRDQGDPDYYKRISAKAAKARKAKKAKADSGQLATKDKK